MDIIHLRTHFFTSQGVVKAVDGVNLRIMKGEAVGIVGESGCGKSTLALSILRLIQSPPGKIVDGEINFKRNNIVKLKEKEIESIRGREISMIFQDPMTYLNPVMKIGDQIKEVIVKHQGITSKEATKKVLDSLKMVNIPDPDKIYRYYPHQLSGGMRQRVLIATALVCNPSLIIADEPTTALDVTIQKQILCLIRDVMLNMDTSLLLITHDLGIVAFLVDYVYVMYAGKIVESADIYSIYEKPKHPYTKGLLSSVLSIDETKEELKSIKGTIPDLFDPPSGCRFHPRCQEAMDICKMKEPQPIKVGENHEVFCWLYSGEK